MAEGQGQGGNPWLTMWIRPRRTIRQIVETDPRRQVLLLAMLGGVAQALDRASLRNLGDVVSLPMLLAVCLLVGAIAGLIGLYLGGALLRWTGSWIGGQASSVEVRAAIAWASVPQIWGLLLWVPLLALFRDGLFKRELPSVHAPWAPPLLFGLAGVGVIIGLWSLVVFLKSLGEVHHFSAWKALGAAVLAGLVILVPVLLLVFAVAALT